VVPAKVTGDPGGIKMPTGRAIKKGRLWRYRHAASRPANLQPPGRICGTGAANRQHCGVFRRPRAFAAFTRRCAVV